jgi:hypothetical protein
VRGKIGGLSCLYINPNEDEDENDDVNVGDDKKRKTRRSCLLAGSEDHVKDLLCKTDSYGSGHNEGAQIPHMDSTVRFSIGLSLDPAYQNRITFIEQNLVIVLFFQFSIWLNPCLG